MYHLPRSASVSSYSYEHYKQVKHVNTDPILPSNNYDSTRIDQSRPYPESIPRRHKSQPTLYKSQSSTVLPPISELVSPLIPEYSLPKPFKGTSFSYPHAHEQLQGNVRPIQNFANPHYASFSEPSSYQKQADGSLHYMPSQTRSSNQSPQFRSLTPVHGVSVNYHIHDSQQLVNPNYSYTNAPIIPRCEHPLPNNPPQCFTHIDPSVSQQYPGQTPFITKQKKPIKRRTRTGCLTCRKRRIKCDERKPGCKNCEKSCVHCLGYQNKPTKNELKKGQKTQEMKSSEFDGRILQNPVAI